MIQAPAVVALAPFMFATVLVFTGCQSKCDQTALLAVTEALEREMNSSSEAEVRALNGVAEACPGMPRGLTENLRARYKSIGRTSSMTRHDDEFFDAKSTACDNVQKWMEEVPSAPPEMRARIFYEACGLARLGVLDEGEQLLHGDEDVFFMLAALEQSGVSRDIVRRLGRGLLNSVASLPVAHRRCTGSDDGSACLRLLGVAGIDPIPLENGLGGHSERPSLLLLVSPEAIFWDGQAIVGLDHGALRPTDVRRHEILPLATAVEAWVMGVRDTAPAHETMPRLEIAVDRSLPVGVLADILFTVTKAGVSNLALVGATSTASVATPVWVPDGSSLSDSEGIAGPVVVDNAGVRATLPSGVVMTVPASASEEVGAIAEKMRASGYDRVLVRVPANVRAEVVVPVLNALSGSGCFHDFVYELRGDGCLRPTLVSNRTSSL